MNETGAAPMAGKTVWVTGGTAGIGRATAVGLATMGACVAITGRDRERAEDAARAIRAASGGKVDVLIADMSSQSEVRRLADEALQNFPRIDVLVNNVGGYWSTRHVTADGLELTLALNYLASFLLTNLLLDRLTRSSPARVVTVSSHAHARGRIEFADLQGEASYSGPRAYNQSKLANIMFTYELARRLRGSGVTATVLASRRRAHWVRSRGPGRHSALARSVRETVHEKSRSGRGHLDLLGLRLRYRPHVRPVLCQRQAEAVVEA
jgi:NAD(P)-dependent dehydrogenase (short-subunit alcohol dehydrogenase family)